jgi:hypothetical protein
MRPTPVFIGVILSFLFSLPAPAAAVPVTVGEAYKLAFHAETCHDCPLWSSSTLPNVTMDGVLTVIDTTDGLFWDVVYADFAYKNVTMITGVTGTVTVDCMGILSCSGNGTYAMAFVPPANGDGSYLFAGTPMYFQFAAGSTSGIIRNDHFLNYYSGPGSNQLPVTFSVTRVPDAASSVLLIAMGMAGLAGMRVVTPRLIPKHRRRADNGVSDKRTVGRV